MHRVIKKLFVWTGNATFDIYNNAKLVEVGDALYSVKLDTAYNIVFCGGTSSSNIITTPNAYQKNFGGGVSDALIGKIDQKNFSLKFSIQFN